MCIRCKEQVRAACTMIPVFHKAEPGRHEGVMSQSMEGRVAVVSGASRGVGRATAIRLGQDGATVVLLARRKLLLDEVVEIIGPSAVPIVSDLTSSQDVHAAFAQIAAQ